MVVKTESCYFSEQKIYPGHGTVFVRKDGKLLRFLSNKNASMYHQGIRALRLTWSQAWRRANKKVRVDVISRRRNRRRARLQKAIGGISLEDIRKKRAQKPAFRKAQRDAASRELKERTKKAQEIKKAKQQKAGHVKGPKQQFSKKGKR